MRPCFFVVFVAIVTLTFLLVAPASAFDLHRHARLTAQVLERQGVPVIARSLIAFGAMLPDVQDCVLSCYCDYAPSFCQPDSVQAVPHAVNHFDNNLLNESIYRVNDNMGIAQAGVVSTPTEWRAAGRTLIAFGRALHTTQDFYAHSTFLEINLFLMRRNPLNVPVWQGQPYAGFPWTTADGLTGGGGIETGYYLQGGPFGSYTHGLLNKDNADGSAHGRVQVEISAPTGMWTTLYGITSGDLQNDMQFTDYGLAPRHTIFALNVLLNGGIVFPFVFGPADKGPAQAASPQQVAAFFEWVEQNPDLIAAAEAADALIAQADSDSIGSFPIDAIDADGLPLPLTTSVVGPSPSRGRLLALTGPNPFTIATTFRILAPSNGRMLLAVFDVKGRRVATLVDADVTGGFHEAGWDGHDDAGRPVPAGIYFVRVAGFGRTESRRVAVAR